MIVTGRRRVGVLPAPPYAIPTAIPYNAPEHLVTPTYDGSGNFVHPDVIDFWVQHGIRKFQGYRFWMVFTPYPNDQDYYENPSILVSNDAVTWVEPEGITNPIYPPPGLPDFNYDTDWAYLPESSELVLIFGAPGLATTASGWVVARSNDGITWPAEPTGMVRTTPPEGPVSPALVRRADDTWFMFAVASQTRKLYRWSAPAPEGPWEGLIEATIPARTWHVDVIRIGSKLYALVDRSPDVESIMAMSSTDDGVTWTANASPVITSQSGRWDHFALYRPTLQPHENGTHMRVWYTGKVADNNPTNSWHLGYTEIPLAEWP